MIFITKATLKTMNVKREKLDSYGIYIHSLVFK